MTTSSHNFDCGALYIEDDGMWRVIGPTEPGPQLWRSGGEVAVWTSNDQGATWKKAQQITHGSAHNHCYVRRVLDAHPEFYGLWADGHGHDKSAPCRLYFCNKAGEVRRLPQAMSGEFAPPEKVEQKR